MVNGKDFEEDDNEIARSDEKRERKSWFRRVAELLKSVFFPVSVDEHLINARASDINMSMDDLSRSYDDVKRASLLCDKALKIAGQRADLAGKQQVIKDKLDELRKFEEMTPEEKKHITNILEKYKHVTQERQSLRGQMSSFTKMLEYLEPYENELEGTISSMNEAEDKQRRLKQDMSYIAGERSELEYEKETIEGTLKLIYKISIGLAVFFSVAVVVLLYLFASRGIEIFMFAVYCSAALIILMTLLYIFRRRLVFEDKMNVLLQIRAVELLNRKKILYVHYTSFLNYEYKKYRVKSVYELRQLWKEYGYYKHVSQRYGNIRNIVYAIEDELQDFLKKHGLHKTKTSVESFGVILDFENNKRQYRRFSEQLEFTDGKLSLLEADQKKVWDELVELKERDSTKDKVIERMMSEYFEDVSKVLPIEDEKDDFNYSY